MSGKFIEAIRSDPISLLSKEPSLPLESVKTYLDGVIKLSKSYGFKPSEIDEVTIDGLDANQVWWQAKMVLDSVEGDLLERIQENQEEANSESEEYEGLADDSDHVSDLENDEVSSESENEADNASESGSFSDSETPESKDLPITFDKGASKDTEDEETSKLESTASTKFGNEDQDGGAYGEDNGVNDDFFNLEEFNAQTIGIEESANVGTDDESVDYFNDIPSDEEEEAIYYDDFFDKPGLQHKKTSTSRINNDKNSVQDLAESDYDEAVDSAKLDLFAEEAEASGEDEHPGNSKADLSTFEKQQIDIQGQIEQLEREAIAEKKWTLKGEVEAQDRPADSLLTEDVDFDRTAKPVPVVTTEVTESIEQLIRRRIQEYNFDDLQKRIVSDLSSQRVKSRFELSDQKSSKSLAEIYEDDYNNVPQDAEVSEELKKSHDEIANLFSNLCYKLDALSSAHFIPKPAEKSLEVRVDTAAISMEDAQPLSMSSASALAPQEIYKVGRSGNSNEITLKNGLTMSKDELTRDDKNRLRRAAKRKRSKTVSRTTKKKSRKDEVVDTLAKNRNITVINNKGEKHDVRGRAINTIDSGSGANRIKL